MSFISSNNLITNLLLKLFLFSIFICFAPEIYAQKDSLKVIQADSTKQISYQDSIKKSARTSSLLSLALPGLGQARNKSWWKIPVIYAALGTSGYFIFYNQKQYKRYQKAYRENIDGDSLSIDEFQGRIAPDVLRSQRDYFRRNRDLIGLLFLVGYGLQALEAFTDSHLKDFNVNEQLSMGIHPSFHATSLGLAIRFRWK